MRRIINPYTGYAGSKQEDRSVIMPISVLLMLFSLIEEIQVYGNRMEAGLSDKRSWKNLRDSAKELKEEIKELERERKIIQKKIAAESKKGKND